MTVVGNKRASKYIPFSYYTLYIISANALRFLTNMWIGFMHPVSIVKGNIIYGNQRIICF